jgi:hypothetical protein
MASYQTVPSQLPHLPPVPTADPYATDLDSGRHLCWKRMIGYGS